MLGRTLGSYRIVRQLGAGGMGVVYVAEHERLGRPAAVKVVSPELSSNQEVVDRFFAEAVAAARIKHAGMVQVFDYGEDEDTGCAYFAMELLEGEPLSARIARGVVHPAAALQIGEQIADCLEAAHAQGIVHRDLKPDNVFLVPDKLVAVGWRAKVLDFGVAKLAESDEIKSLRTRTGSVLGTPYYMSPEQSRGAGTVDHRSDVYSLGCVLFEMVTGRVPFPGEGLGEVLGAHQHVAPPAPRSINPGLPAAIDQLLLDCLAKRPDDRPQTMADLARRLEAALLHVSDAGSTMVGTGAMRARAGTSSETAAGAGIAASAGAAPTTGAGATGPAGPVATRETTLGGTASQVAATPGEGAPPTRSSSRGIAIAAAAAVAVLGGGAALLAVGGGDPAPPAPVVQPTPAPAPEPAAPPATLDDDAGHRWLLIRPAPEPVVLGVADDAPDAQLGFRAARRVRSPTAAYYLHEHEVTFGELEQWLPEDRRGELALGPWVPDAAEARAALPATGVPWSMALAYCKSRGGALPSEEQWEFAARGADLRPSPWGSQRIDRDRTRVYAGPKGRPANVMQQDQDETPDGLHDMLGNAMEWTSDLWRMARPGADESWVQADGMTFRAVRGLPYYEKAPRRLPAVPAAFRDARCTAGPCLEDARKLLVHTGFRCARDVSSAAID